MDKGFQRLTATGNNGTRTPITMPDGPGVYLIGQYRVQKSGGSAGGSFQPKIYEAASGSDIDTLAHQHVNLYGSNALATLPMDTQTSNFGPGGRYVRTDSEGKIYVEPGQSGGSVDPFKWVLYAKWVGFY